MRFQNFGSGAFARRNKLWGVLAVAVVAYLAWFVWTRAFVSPMVNPLTGLDETVARPFLLAMSKEKLDELDDRQYLDSGHPLQSVMRAFNLLYHGGDTRNPNHFEREGYLRRARSIIDYLLHEWEPAERLADGSVRLGYGFEYRGHAPGWWSGMVEAQFALVLEVAAEYFHESNYHAVMKASLGRMLKSPRDGGIMWSNEWGCWFSEYSWEGISQDDEFFVVNGHLYAFQALLMLHELYPDRSLGEALECAEIGTVAKSEAFFPGEGKWPLYMLEEPTINMVHYVLYEAAQFDALATLTGDAEFAKQAHRRRSVLAEQYPVVWWRDEEGGVQLFFSLLGAPNPYGADTFAVEITCSFADDPPLVFSQWRPLDETLPLVDRSFAAASADSVPDKCVVVSHDEGDSVLMHESQPIELRSGPFRAEKIESVLPCCDVRLDETGTDLLLDPAFSTRPNAPEHYLNTQGRVSWDFSAAREDAWVIGVEVLPGQSIKAGVQFSCNGETSFRYVPKLTGGKENLALLHWLGFPDSDHLDCVDRITFFFYTSDVETVEPVPVRFGRTLAFANRRQLREFLMLHPGLQVNADGAQP